MQSKTSTSEEIPTPARQDSAGPGIVEEEKLNLQHNLHLSSAESVDLIR